MLVSARLWHCSIGRRRQTRLSVESTGVPDAGRVDAPIALWVAGAARRIANMPPAFIPSISTEPASHEMHHRVLPVQGQ